MRSFLHASIFSLLLCAGCAHNLPREEWHAALAQMPDAPGRGVSVADAEVEAFRAIGPHLPRSAWLEFDLIVEEPATPTARYRLRIEGPLEPTPLDRVAKFRLTSDGENPGPAITATGTSLHRGRIVVHDPEGERAVSHAALPLGWLSGGFIEAAQVATDGFRSGAEPSAEDQVHLVQATASFLGLGVVASANDHLQDLVLSVAQWPSLWRCLIPGFSINLRPSFGDATFKTGPLGPACRFPLEVQVKGDPALYAQVTAWPPYGPLLLSGGIVRFEGFPPDKPTRRVTIQLAAWSPMEASDSTDRILPSVSWERKAPTAH